MCPASSDPSGSAPRAYPDPRSRTVAALLTVLVAFGPMSTDLYLPSLPAMVEAFDTSVSRAQLTLSVFMAGLALGMLIHGPLSDRYGRRPVLIGGVALYVVASVACVLAPTVEALIAARFVQALGACAGPVIGRAVVRDVYDRGEAARMLSLMASAMALAPAVAPILGGALFSLFGWRANFGVLVVFGVVALTGTWWLLAETNRHRDPMATRPGRLAGTFAHLLRHRAFVGYTLTVSFGFAGLFGFISGSSFVIIDVLGVAPELFGFAFMAVVIGYILGAASGGRLSGRVDLDRLIGAGVILATLSGGVAAALAWAGIQSVAALVPLVSIYFFATAWIIPLGTAGALSPFPRIAGAVSSLLGFIQMAIGATAGVLVGVLHDGTTRTLTTLLFLMGVCGLVAFLALVWRRPPAESPGGPPATDAPNA
ncbi:multidrug effflux MFS transporter [Roseospira visakhapatnamensis]|uniref:Bcr/CflA family efflux transporter n=1 Tax=Roseospira visakhapatnamensis TaxID=390880 RepID=A0A7W6WBR5_9PROT|nr:multidrug effflux MFS transporter [Roseospira visakhapatnamensis]MBB4268098.1 DHA1 family bicyclomycin/chloramphenicol resistance-like MFS transporter [Roseospira visakhapatnamensis]